MLSQSTNFGIWAGYILIHYHSRQLFHVGIWKALTNTLKYEKNGSVMVTEAALRPKYELLQFLVVSTSSTTFFRDVPLNHTRSRRSEPFEDEPWSLPQNPIPSLCGGSAKRYQEYVASAKMIGRWISAGRAVRGISTADSEGILTWGQC